MTGPDHSSVAQTQTAFELDVFGKRGPTLVKGEGALLWDDTGKRYIDCIGGHGAAVLGHAHPSVTDALARQSRLLSICPGSFFEPTRAGFMKRLVESAPPGLERVFLCNSGTEANEAAIKFARLSTGKSKIIAFQRGFHGRTLGSMSISSYSQGEDRFGPIPGEVEFLPLQGDIGAVRTAISTSPAACVLEIVQGEGGVHPIDPELLLEIQSLCREHQVILIVDEVQTGFGRTGKLFACDHVGLEPDILCLAKGIAAGFPMGAVVTSGRIQVPVGAHGSTFGGNPLACAVAETVLDIVERPEFLNAVSEKGAWLCARLAESNLPVMRTVRGMGLMVGLELRRPVRPYLMSLAEHGVLALGAGKRVLRLLPPLIIEQPELEECIAALQEVLVV